MEIHSLLDSLLVILDRVKGTLVDFIAGLLGSGPKGPPCSDVLISRVSSGGNEKGLPLAIIILAGALDLDCEGGSDVLLDAGLTSSESSSGNSVRASSRIIMEVAYLNLV